MSKMTNLPRPNNRTFGCSLREDILEKLDNVRGDVNRSRYIQRLIEKNIDTIPQILPKVGAPRESVISMTKGACCPNGK